MAAILTDVEAAQVCAEYAQGATLRELAERYYCNHMTIRRYVLNHGGVTRSRGARKQPNIPMIVHDWNAGIDTERMAMIYGYADAVSMRQMVYRCRKQGWDFEIRKKGRKHG